MKPQLDNDHFRTKPDIGGGGTDVPAGRWTGTVGSIPIGEFMTGAPVELGVGYMFRLNPPVVGGGPTAEGAIIKGGGPTLLGR